MSIGECLRYERDKRGLSVAEVAKATRLSVATIQGLEEDNYDRMPHQQVYIRGYIRSYCSVLGIDANTLLGERIIPVRKPEEEYDARTTEYHYRLIRIWGSLLVISVIVVLIFLWWSERSAPLPDQEPPALNPAAEELLTPSAPVQPASHPYSPLIGAGAKSDRPHASTVLIVPDGSTARAAESIGAPPFSAPPLPPKSFLTIKSSSQCWSHITDGQGQVIVNKLLPPGYHKTIYGYAPFQVQLGNALGIDLWLDGEKQDFSAHISRTTRYAAFVIGEPPPE